MVSKIIFVLISLAVTAKTSLVIKEDPLQGTFFIAGRNDAEDAVEDPEAEIRTRVRSWVRMVDAEGIDPECHDYVKKLKVGLIAAQNQEPSF